MAVVTAWRQLQARPLLVVSAVVGLAVAWAAPLWLDIHRIAGWILGWDAGAGLYILMAARMMARSTPQALRQRAEQLDEGQLVILAMVVLAAVASLSAIVAELAMAKTLSGPSRYAHITLAVVTILMSWVFTHLMFALHYAHDFHIAQGKGHDGGLMFPGEAQPGYGDFVYLSFIIGTSAQTADVSFTSRHMRRIGLVHSVLSFIFNTTVLALMINIAASLF